MDWQLFRDLDRALPPEYIWIWIGLFAPALFGQYIKPVFGRDSAVLSHSCPNIVVEDDRALYSPFHCLPHAFEVALFAFVISFVYTVIGLAIAWIRVILNFRLFHYTSEQSSTKDTAHS